MFEKINLEGYMVGNGCTNWTYDSTADTATYANFNVIPKSWWTQYTDLNCYSGPVELWK